MLKKAYSFAATNFSHSRWRTGFILVALFVFSRLIYSLLIRTSDAEVISVSNIKLSSSSIDKTRDGKKFAYVFYVTSSDYSCYALINAHRLIFDLRSNPEIDIVILATNGSMIGRLCSTDDHCSFPVGRVKIRTVSADMETIGQSLTDNVYYADSYVRFEAFGLCDYDRIVILDADGFVLQNIDHLFQLDLGEHEVAASLAYYLPKRWISSVLLVVKPSKELYEKLKNFLTPDNMRRLSVYANGAHFDMDILNYLLSNGNQTHRLSKYYALLDSYFLEEDTLSQRRENELNATYYVHFTVRKPLEYLETRPWPLKVNSVNATAVSTSPPSAALDLVGTVYYPFWKAFDTRCRVLVQKVPAVPDVPPGEFSFGYPDQSTMVEFVNNSNYTIIVHS